MKINHNLRRIRQENGQTQESIAKVLGITRQAYTRYESGSREPDLHSLHILAAFYGYPVAVFFIDQEQEGSSSNLSLTELSALYEKTAQDVKNLVKRSNDAETDESDNNVLAQELHTKRQALLLLKRTLLDHVKRDTW
jgi:transcriptional regulator with XRE-family HTH domain